MLHTIKLSVVHTEIFDLVKAHLPRNKDYKEGGPP